MENRQIDNKTKQIRINAVFHRKLKIIASQKELSIKALIEQELQHLVQDLAIE